MKNYHQPNQKGEFGEFGGRFLPDFLEKRLKQVEIAYSQVVNDKSFQAEFHQELNQFANRPSSLYLAKRFLGESPIKLYLKREDLNHTGAHKINNAIGQILLAKRLGKTTVIAETGAGQHGVATATVAARYGLKCVVYMGARDIDHQRTNVYRMQLLGATVVPVTQGQGTLKDAVDAALAAYAKDETAYYLLGSAVGPHPYPLMVRDFQSVIGREAKQQLQQVEGKLPDYAIACVGGGSNAIGLFYEFITNGSVKLVAVEPAGKGEHTRRHGLSLGKGVPGIVHGFKCKVLQNPDGSIRESYSAASGLDYPGVGPELSHLHSIGRLQTAGITDDEAINAFVQLSRTEGIMPALESAHALAYVSKHAASIPKDSIVLVNLSGRGDKDVETLIKTDTIQQRKHI